MKRKILLIVAIVLLLAGIVVFVTPYISNALFHHSTDMAKEEFFEKYDSLVVNNASENKVENKKNNNVVDKQEKIENIESYNYFSYETNTTNTSEKEFSIQDIEKLNQLYRELYKYNEMLKSSQRRLLVNGYSYKFPIVDLTEYGIDDGVIGYIKADSISLNLPILLGCNDETMAQGAAHITYTSVPLGGIDTNTVLASHTAYSLRLLFDYLPLLEIGDEIEVNTIFSKMSYVVIECQTVDKDDSDCLFIQKGKDLLTLMTCIANGNGDYDRYVVVCQRK